MSTVPLLTFLLHFMFLLVIANSIASEKEMMTKGPCTRVMSPRLNLTRLKSRTSAYKVAGTFKRIFPEFDPFDEKADCGNRFRLTHPWLYRVAGGTDVVPTTLPWVVKLFTFSKVWMLDICSGALIAYKWVLTAAHCLKGSFMVWVRAGIYDEIDHELASMAISVPKDIFLHPNYNGPYENDIALLKVEFALRSLYFPKPACLPLHKKRLQVNQRCFVAGWGVWNFKNYEMATKLQRLDMKVVRKNNTVIYTEILDKRVRVPTGDCNGDSGGPLMCVIDGLITLYGVITGGSNICDKRLKNTYSYCQGVTGHLDWIKQTMEHN